MNMKNLVKACNIIGLVSISLLVYWVFAFILITVFGLKVFRAHISEMFTLSIFGIIALMAGALMLNIMLNLTRIAEREQAAVAKQSKKWLLAFVAVFPLLAAVLVGGNYFTAQQKQRLLIHSAEQLIQDNPRQTSMLADYQFTLDYLRNTGNYLQLLEKRDTAFRHIEVIVADKIDGMPVYLSLGRSRDLDGAQAVADNAAVHRTDEIVFQQANNSMEHLKKVDYVFSADVKEREYLQTVFAKQASAHAADHIRFVADDGRYEVFYPYYDGKQTIVFRLSDYQRYGKLGSY